MSLHALLAWLSALMGHIHLGYSILLIGHGKPEKDILRFLSWKVYTWVSTLQSKRRNPCPIQYNRNPSISAIDPCEDRQLKTQLNMNALVRQSRQISVYPVYGWLVSHGLDRWSMCHLDFPQQVSLQGFYRSPIKKQILQTFHKYLFKEFHQGL